MGALGATTAVLPRAMEIPGNLACRARRERLRSHPEGRGRERRSGRSGTGEAPGRCWGRAGPSAGLAASRAQASASIRSSIRSAARARRRRSRSRSRSGPGRQRRVDDARHRPGPVSPTAWRWRASRLIAAMSSDSAGPLARPSSHRRRSSGPPSCPIPRLPASRATPRARPRSPRHSRRRPPFAGTVAAKSAVSAMLSFATSPSAPRTICRSKGSHQVRPGATLGSCKKGAEGRDARWRARPSHEMDEKGLIPDGSATSRSQGQSDMDVASAPRTPHRPDR